MLIGCSVGAQSVLSMLKVQFVCNLCFTVRADRCSQGGDGDHPPTLILLHHQLPSISPTGALYDVCQLITSDRI